MEHKEQRRALSSLRCGQSGVVSAVETEGTMRRRLQDLGLICGTHVECVGISPLGDPAAFRIRGAVIALRRADSDTVRLCD
ncbi:MAG: ferrous iron transport protein A [Clostridia bacterium]|nr:ferrous iron transport protein A [Clostridia bacterium]